MVERLVAIFDCKAYGEKLQEEEEERRYSSRYTSG